MISKLWAKFYLWWNGCCTKHFEEKESFFDGISFYSQCKMCETEKKERTRVRIVNAIKILGGL